MPIGDAASDVAGAMLWLWSRARRMSEELKGLVGYKFDSDLTTESPWSKFSAICLLYELGISKNLRGWSSERSLRGIFLR